MRVLAEKPEDFGALAKRLCSGLQIRLVRFDSGTRLQISLARVVESVDTRDLKSLGCKAVRVQVSSRVPRKFTRIIKAIKQCRGRREAVFLYLFFPFRIHFHNIIDLRQQELLQSFGRLRCIFVS